MENVYLVNMDKDIVRLKTSTKLLNLQGYNVIRYPGIDVTTLDLSSYKIENATNGIIGCSLAHTGLMQKLLDSSFEYIIISEDDIVPKRPASDIKAFMKLVPKDYDVIHIGCEFGCNVTPTLQDRFVNMYFSAPPAIKVNDEVVKSYLFIGTHFYIVSRKGATKILDSIGNDHSNHIDIRISQVKDIIIYSATKPFGHAALTGLCTDSNIVNGGTSVKKELCLLDNIRISESRTIGYILFAPFSHDVLGLRVSAYDIFIFILLGIAVVYFLVLIKNRKYKYV